MDGRAKAFLTTAVLVASSVCALSKTLLPNSSPQAADLRVTVIPDKNTFILHESVYTRVEFKNLGNKVYCFPKPARDCTNDFPGSVVTTGRPVKGTGDFEQFICHYDTGGPRNANLESEIKQHWVILAPNDAYLTDSAVAQVDLNVLGEWRLETKYWQPQGAFNPTAVKKRLTSAAESAGCAIPSEPIPTEPVTIHVVEVKSKN